MESNSSSNRILCSEKSYKLLKEQAPDIPAHRRGKISVKGKGEMLVYWVGGSRWVGGFPLPKEDTMEQEKQQKEGKHVGFSEDEAEDMPLEQVAV